MLRPPGAPLRRGVFFYRSGRWAGGQSPNVSHLSAPLGEKHAVGGLSVRCCALRGKETDRTCRCNANSAADRVECTRTTIHMYDLFSTESVTIRGGHHRTAYSDRTLLRNRFLRASGVHNDASTTAIVLAAILVLAYCKAIDHTARTRCSVHWIDRLG